MKEVKISIRLEKDEIPLINDIKNLALSKHGVKENHFIYRTIIRKTIGGTDEKT